MPYAEFTAGVSRQIDGSRHLAPIHRPNLLTILNNFNRTNKEHFPGRAIYSIGMIKGNILSIRGSMSGSMGNELWIGGGVGGKAGREGLR